MASAFANKTLASMHDYLHAVACARRRGHSSPWRSVGRARFVYGHGPRMHALFELDRRPESEWPEFIDSPEANRRHRPLSERAAKMLTQDKLAFTAHCQRAGLPVAPVTCVLDSSSEDYSCPNAIDPQTWDRCIESAPDSLYFKPINGIHGTGNFVAQRRGGDRWHYAGTEGSAADLRRHCLDSKWRWLVQPELRPHAAIRDAFSPAALATIRAVTWLSNGEPVLAFTILRIPTGDNATDNFSEGRDGNLVAPIDVHSGRVGIARGSRSRKFPDMYATRTHPDTAREIEGFCMPHWEAVRDLALRGQAATASVPSLGWDIAITDAGPVIIEANCNYAVELIEIALQRGIRRDLTPTFDGPRAQQP